MPTISDLGRKIKKETKAYDHLTDEQVGRLAKRKYPGKFEDYEDVNMGMVTRMEMGVVPNEGMYGQSPAISQPLSHARELLTFYDPHQSQFMSWWGTRGAAKRADFLDRLTIEQTQVFRLFMTIQDQVLSGERSMMAYKEFVERHAMTLFELKMRAENMLLAFKREIPLENYGELRLEEEKSKIRVSEREQMVKIELDERWKQIEQDNEAADRIATSKQEIAKKLTDEIVEAIKKRYAYEHGSEPPEVKQKILDTYDRYIEQVEELRDAGKTRRNVSPHRTTAGRNQESQTNGGRTYPAASNDDPDEI